MDAEWKSWSFANPDFWRFWKNLNSHKEARRQRWDTTNRIRCYRYKMTPLKNRNVPFPVSALLWCILTDPEASSAKGRSQQKSIWPGGQNIFSLISVWAASICSQIHLVMCDSARTPGSACCSCTHTYTHKHRHSLLTHTLPGNRFSPLLVQTCSWYSLNPVD